ncbi:MAG TPA: hypothetical protein VF184_05225, partial [Phycisphaeraceae bacterium]
ALVVLTMAGCGQTRTFVGTYDEVWRAASASLNATHMDRQGGHLQFRPRDAPFGSDGYGVIYRDIWIRPTDDGTGEPHEYQVRVYIRGQDILNPFPFLHGYPEYEEEVLDAIEAELAR